MTASSKVRLYDLAKDLKVDVKRLIEDVRGEGVNISVPSNSISKELAEKIRHKYFPTKNTPAKPTIKLLYEPDHSRRKKKRHPKKRIKQLHSKERICPLCGLSCLSKVERRSHLVSDHMHELMAGKVLCRVSANELCQATGADLKQLKGIATRIGCELRKGSDYIPPILVKELARRIRLSEPIRSNTEVNEGRASQAVSNNDYSVSRSATKLTPECFDRLQQKDFGQLRKLVDDCLKGRPVSRGMNRLSPQTRRYCWSTLVFSSLNFPSRLQEVFAAESSQESLGI